MKPTPTTLGLAGACALLAVLSSAAPTADAGTCRLGMDRAEVLRVLGVPDSVTAGGGAVRMRFGTPDARALDVFLHDDVVIAVLERDVLPPAFRPLPRAGVHVGLSSLELIARAPDAPSEVSYGPSSVELVYPSGATALLADGIDWRP